MLRRELYRLVPRAKSGMATRIWRRDSPHPKMGQCAISAPDFLLPTSRTGARASTRTALAAVHAGPSLAAATSST